MTPEKQMLSKFTMVSPRQLAQNAEAKRMGKPVLARESQ